MNPNRRKSKLFLWSLVLLIATVEISAQQPRLSSGQIDLGERNAGTWLSQNDLGDGKTQVVVQQGREGRTAIDSPEMIAPPARNLYMYFDFGGDFLSELPAGTVATVTVTYWDEGRDHFTLEYDSYNPQGGPFEGAYTPSRMVYKRDTRSWKDAVFVLPDARFAGRQNGESDFRINSLGDGDELIDKVMISLNPPAPLHHPAAPGVDQGGDVWRAINFGVPHIGWGVNLAPGSYPPGKWISGRKVAVLNEPVALIVQDDYLSPGIHYDVFVTIIYLDGDSEFTLRYEDPQRGWIQASRKCAGTGTGLFRRGVFRLDRFVGHSGQNKDFEIAPLRGEPAIDRLFVEVAPGPYVGNVALDMSQDRKFTQPTLLTYFFYWYDVRTGAHIYDYGDPNDDALQDHPADMSRFSFGYTDWFDQQLDDILDAGIDIILPVYWGSTRMQKSFSVPGLKTLAKTLEMRDRAGKRSPRIGLFFDTSTLKSGEEIMRESTNSPTDLSTREGKDFFFKHIRDFFSLIPSKHWATVDGKPLVWLYAAGFSHGYGPDLGPYVRERFKNQFGGLDIFLVADVSWGDIGQDATSAWGAAFGTKVHDVAAVGPGYDDRAVPGRTTPQVDRENGAFYRRNWDVALTSGKPWVIIETWDEFHEGTDIADSREYGRQYIQITHEYSQKLHKTPVPSWPER